MAMVARARKPMPARPPMRRPRHAPAPTPSGSPCRCGSRPSSAPAAGDWCCGGQGTVCSYDCSGRSLVAQNLSGPVGACFETDAGCIPTAETIAAACGSNEQYQVNFDECDLLGEAGPGGDGGCPAAAPLSARTASGLAYCTLGACPTAACPVTTGYPFPVPPPGDGDAGGDAGAFDAIHALCGLGPYDRSRRATTSSRRRGSPCTGRPAGRSPLRPGRRPQRSRRRSPGSRPD